MMVVRARVVLPVTAPPIEDGAVLVSGDRIAVVGRWDGGRGWPSGPVVDAGDSVLMPGLVNAHCHLDYTHLAGHLPPPKRFSDWLHGVLGLKAGWSFSEYADSWLAGARELLGSGCTTVMDFEAVPELLPEVWHGTPLRVISALELTGLRAGRSAEDVLGEALERVDRLQPPPAGKSVALAPHAPYSTRPELIRLAAVAARERGMRIACHVAESADEYEMFESGTGAMHQWLRSQRDMSDCGMGTPVAHVARWGLLGEGTILVHMNHLGAGDLGLVAGTGAAVVHCPRSHDYFGHEPFGYARFREAGVPVALGTDSLMSVRRGGVSGGMPKLSMFEEMRLFLERQAGLTPGEVLGLATVGGARVLGRGGELGEVREGCLADLVVVPWAGGVRGAEEGVVGHRGEVSGVMLGGRWVVPLGGVGGGAGLVSC